jgi:hypothetical protein
MDGALMVEVEAAITDLLPGAKRVAKAKAGGKGAGKTRKRQIDALVEDENKENEAVIEDVDAAKQGLLLHREIDRAYSL